MAIQQIQKSSVFKPDMIGDIVEVVLYNKTDGTLLTVVGTLEGYQQAPGVVGAWFAHDRDGQPGFTTKSDAVTLTITHYEYVPDLSDAEDDK